MTVHRARRILSELGDSELADFNDAFRDVLRARAQMTQPVGLVESDRRYPGQAARAGLTLDSIDDCFTFQSPSPFSLEAMTQVRESSIALAKTILRQVPDCADRSTALRKLREARMWANSALALGGRF